MHIDAHQHLWRYLPPGPGWMGDGMEGLRRDFLIDDLRVITAMYFREVGREPKPIRSASMSAAIAIAALATIGLGLLPRSVPGRQLTSLSHAPIAGRLP